MPLFADLYNSQSRFQCWLNAEIKFHFWKKNNLSDTLGMLGLIFLLIIDLHARYRNKLT